MQFSVTFRKMDPSDALKDYARDKLSRMQKYLDAIMEANVVLSVEKFRHIADVTIMCDGIKINAQEQTEDMYSAIDMVVDKIERQLKRSRQKIRNHKTSKRSKTKEAEVEAAPGEEDTGEESAQVVVSRQIFAKPMDVDEAVMQLDLSDENFLVFINSTTEKLNVIHYREDGNYGLIEPVLE